MKGWPLLVVMFVALLALAFTLGAQAAFNVVESDPIVIIRDVCDTSWKGV